MALTRKFLSALGIESDKVDEIINAHSETVNALKAERDEAREKADKFADLEKENRELKKQVSEAEMQKGKEDSYKVKYEAIKEEFDTYKNGIETEKTTKIRTDAFKAFLKQIGISEKRIDAVTRVTDLTKLTCEDGKIVDEKGELEKSLKEEWADFIVTEDKRGADVQKPPKNDGGKDEDNDSSFAAQRAAKYFADKYGTPQSKEEK